MTFRVAVTGASGFCGGAVAQMAAGRGWEVVCLGRRPGPVGTHRRWDAASETPDLSDVDAVVHLAAAVGDPGPSERVFQAVNVDGTARVAGAAGSRPFVHVSSASVYAPGPYPVPVREDHPTGGQRSAYGRSKAAAEHRAPGAVILRPRAVYGPGDPHLLPRLRRAQRAGHVWLPGPDVPLSLTSVNLLARACLDAIANAWPPGAYNIADPITYRRDQVIADALGAPIRHVPAAAARALAFAARATPTPVLTRYAVDQLTDGMVLNTTKSTAVGLFATPHPSLPTRHKPKPD
ncbi:NAD(P)-dependent oxidoreductase [Actinoplanes sp. NBRC 103695]|uniref:NAD-dependent epimerase/dehydratase family protein n=1 Tax=Actinoplanes sp. NBRC 103695 TaxID=3032202 RepID=UPI0024A10ED4|nr:NAD(P)-dependent oxidoreductase [Actinoplanes sp. NBRC 103695]GLY95901.1 NAD-dependent epimerase [Actinoplanes sp. NBRC 103695]